MTSDRLNTDIGDALLFDDTNVDRITINIVKKGKVVWNN